MRGLVLGVADYRLHTSDEGEQLQAGLAAAGWDVAGHGYGDGCVDVPELLDRHSPDVVLVQDPRDWDARSTGCFDLRGAFLRAEAMAGWPDLLRVVVLKDAACCPVFQEERLRSLGADAALVYYHESAVRLAAPWLPPALPLFRTYHSVDGALLARLDLGGRRRPAVVSGATAGEDYPLRRGVMAAARGLGLDVLRHPGHGNGGCRTPDYLATLCGYKVHVATASRHGFALRKIVESVACGATPVTNLPVQDELPEVDGALVRVPPGAGVREVADAVRAAAEGWTLGEARRWAERARGWYDYRAVGARLSADLLALATARRLS